MSNVEFADENDMANEVDMVSEEGTGTETREMRAFKTAKDMIAETNVKARAAFDTINKDLERAAFQILTDGAVAKGKLPSELTNEIIRDYVSSVYSEISTSDEYKKKVTAKVGQMKDPTPEKVKQKEQASFDEMLAVILKDHWKALPITRANTIRATVEEIVEAINWIASTVERIQEDERHELRAPDGTMVPMVSEYEYSNAADTLLRDGGREVVNKDSKDPVISEMFELKAAFLEAIKWISAKNSKQPVLAAVFQKESSGAAIPTRIVFDKSSKSLVHRLPFTREKINYQQLSYAYSAPKDQGIKTTGDLLVDPSKLQAMLASYEGLTPPPFIILESWFQRASVWTTAHASDFVYSVLNSEGTLQPKTPIILVKVGTHVDSNGNEIDLLVVPDGKQRLDTGREIFTSSIPCALGEKDLLKIDEVSQEQTIEGVKPVKATYKALKKAANACAENADRALEYLEQYELDVQIYDAPAQISSADLTMALKGELDNSDDIIVNALEAVESISAALFIVINSTPIPLTGDEKQAVEVGHVAHRLAREVSTSPRSSGFLKDVKALPTIKHTSAGDKAVDRSRALMYTAGNLAMVARVIKDQPLYLQAPEGERLVDNLPMLNINNGFFTPAELKTAAQYLEQSYKLLGYLNKDEKMPFSHTQTVVNPDESSDKWEYVAVPAPRMARMLVVYFANVLYRNGLSADEFIKEFFDEGQEPDLSIVRDRILEAHKAVRSYRPDAGDTTSKSFAELNSSDGGSNSILYFTMMLALITTFYDQVLEDNIG